jgi:transcriptional regulator with XRE-family HTH domain
MNLNSRGSLIARLKRGKRVRQQFVESNLSKGIAHQIRATRDKAGWSQERLAKEVGMNQNAISRLESSDYGRPTITTLKRVAASLDVGLVVRFVPFSEMIDWVSGTPRVIEGLTTAALAVPSFEREDAGGVFSEGPISTLPRRVAIGPGAADSARTQPDYDRAPLFSLFSPSRQMSPSASVAAHLPPMQQVIRKTAMNAAELTQ